MSPDSGPKLLAVETSSPVFSVAVCRGETTLSFAQTQADGSGRPSTGLADLIQEALNEAGLRMAELDGFALSIGPGSFTGLRVGVVTAKTLAWALKRPVLPVSSLEVLARNLEDSPCDVIPFVDARKGNLYVSSFSPNGRGSLKRVAPDELLRPEEALERIRPPAAVVGDGLNRYGLLLDAAGKGAVRKAPASAWIPRADSLGRVAAAAWPAGAVDDPHRLVPQYLYSQGSDITGW